MSKKLKAKEQPKVGSPAWNDLMFGKHPTPYKGIAGFIEQQRIQSILKGIRQHKWDRILEIGCEAGNLLQAIEKAFPKAQLWGMDISEKALEEARQKLSSEVQFIQSDITQIVNWQEAIPDIIICSETLEHIPDSEAAVRQIAALAGPNTILIFTVPLEKLKNQVKSLLLRLGLFQLLFRGIEEGKSEWHVQDFSASDFQTLIGGHFEIIQYKQIWGLHQQIIAKKAQL
jgi:ubiquinone/menaquinone biosynthesis C-methylase UbiE